MNRSYEYNVLQGGGNNWSYRERDNGEDWEEESIRLLHKYKRGTLGIKFGGVLTEDQMETYRAAFEMKGWKKITDDNERLSWVNPENTWCSSVNKKTGQWLEIDSQWVRNLNMTRANGDKTDLG
jgi:hypothetical protein